MTDRHQNEEIIEAMRILANLLNQQASLSDFSPLRDRVLVIPLKEDDIHKVGSLYVPGGGRNEGSRFAQVVAVGPGYRTSKGVRISTDLNPGDVVIVGRHIGEPVEDQDVEYRLVKSGDILAVMTEGEK